MSGSTRDGYSKEFFSSFILSFILSLYGFSAYRGRGHGRIMVGSSAQVSINARGRHTYRTRRTALTPFLCGCHPMTPGFCALLLVVRPPARDLPVPAARCPSQRSLV